MYVAATRARNIVIVSTYPFISGEKRAWAVLDDALGEIPELQISAGEMFKEREKLVVEESQNWSRGKC